MRQGVLKAVGTRCAVPLQTAIFTMMLIALVGGVLFALASRAAAQEEDVPLPLTQADLSVLTGGILQPNGMVWHDGKLYVSCSGDWTVYELDDTTGATTTYLWGVRDAHVVYAENDADGNLHLWMPDTEDGGLVEVNREGLEVIAGGMQRPWGIARLDVDKFLISDMLAGTVEQVGRDGERETLMDGFAAPTGIVHDGNYVYVANFGSARRGIEWVDLREMEGGAQPLVAGLSNVTGLQLGADGNLYFTYASGGRGIVGRVHPEPCRENGGCTAEQIELVVTSDLRTPIAGLTLSSEGRLYLHTLYGAEIYWAQLDGFAA